MRNAVHTILAALLLMTGLVTANEQPIGRESYDTTVRPLLQKYCIECHGAQKQKAQVRYDGIAGYRNQDRQLWAMVHEKLTAGEMPPEGKPQPTAAEKQAIYAWIEQQATASRLAMGSGNTRRLNRRELSAALQDVTGLKIDFAHALPGDGKLGGFDTGADALQDAEASVSQLMLITRNAVEGIRFLEPSPGKVLTLDAKTINPKDTRKVTDAWKAQGANLRLRTVTPGLGMLIEPKWVGDRGDPTVTLAIPQDSRGVLRIKALLSVKKNSPALPNPHLWMEVGGRDLEYREITATQDKPVEVEYEVSLDDVAIDAKGLSIALTHRIEIPYSVEGFENEDRSRQDKDPVPGGTGWFRPAFDKKLPQEQHPVPWLVLQHLELELNAVVAWPPASWGIKDLKISDDLASAKRLLGIWMERAWRRPVKDAEGERFLLLYQELRKQGLSFDQALRPAFQSVLLSAPFRYLSSPADPDTVISQHAIASRLSFMLWGTPPDADLLKLAAAGKLKDPATLDAQVDRLLADARSEAFFDPFVIQWLEMEQPITIAMDNIQKQDFRFGRFLKESMRKETVQYFRQLVADNRPVAEMVQSDWTMMNNILAIHYGYKGIEGGHLRKVPLRKDDPRGGGILGHAGIQSMLCWMGENWVIYRGAWTLRHVLDDPPPPPPLEVPELVPSKNAGKTFKELLVQHQADANCSICHQKMDPMGFAFQNCDISGRWREVEHENYAMSDLDGKIEWRGVGKTRPVDAVGQLPRGEKFSSFADVKALIATKYREDMIRGIMKNLTIYSAGRLPDVHDMAEIRTIMKQQEAKGYPLRDVMKTMMRSRIFLDQ